MRNELVTPYVGYFERAERWELALDAIVELASHAAARIAKVFHTTTPRSA